MAKATRKVNTPVTETPSARPVNLKEIALSEYKKCLESPEYFILTYVWIQTTVGGRSKFKLYPFQRKLLYLLHTRDRIIVLKSRQLGITTLCAAYALWLFLFKNDSSILCMAPTTNTAKAVMDKFKFAYTELPKWMIELSNSATQEENQKKVVGLNGSKIEVISGAKNSPRGKTASFLIYDEFAFVEDDLESYAAAQQTLATGGKCIVLSTPFGSENKFADLYSEAELGNNEYLPIKLDWTVHPDRDQAWRDAQEKELGKRLASQECDGLLISSGNTYFESEDLDWVKDNLEDPIQYRERDNSFWIWKFPEEVVNCAVIVDTARGDGLDFSTLQVIDLLTGEQVAEYMGDRGPKELAQFAVSICIEYNSALLIVENTGIGNTTCSYVTDLGYKNVYKSLKGDTTNVSQYLNKYQDDDKMTPGFTTSTTTRLPMLDSLRVAVEEKAIKIRSKRLYTQMRSFIWKGPKPTAKSGSNDDLLIPLAIGTYLRGTALIYAANSEEMQRACLGGIRMVTPKPVYSNRNIQNTHYMMPNPVTGEMEDYSWVLNS